MKVLDLRCAHGHAFEGWFGSEDDFHAQRSQGLIECPLCGDAEIERLPSAPRLSLGARAPEPVQGQGPEARPPAPLAPEARLEALWLKAARHVMASTEDVGERFADEARRIHDGVAPERGIRGQASPADAQALRDEGIEVFSMPLPAALKGTRH